MKTLKSKTFLDDTLLTAFVSKNNIDREDILNITSVGTAGWINHTLFYYTEVNPDEEKKKGFWG
ncbi:hypothetical protein [Mucilaginibacter panaciglaebae]|uniref:Uncharacterized protein n=1 Tax=Mucilaginibacter panaciglaebae TaxID=502331 RepID=A0ABP7WNS6_9SPHI